MKIFKYPINLSEIDVRGCIYITMPLDAEVLCVQVQRGVPTLWAKVDADVPLTMRTFVIVGTGHEMPERCGSYIGTFQLAEDTFVFHLFKAC